MPIIYRTTPYDDNYLTYLNKLGEENWIFSGQLGDKLVFRKEVKKTVTRTKAIVFDLDGTLCELKPESDRNNHTGNEEPIESIIYLAKSLMKIDNIKVLILTGRKEKYLHETIHWLVKHDIPAEIVMQTKSQADKNHVFKREQLKKMQEKYDILAVIDDNELVGDVCLELGIIFLQVKTCKK